MEHLVRIDPLAERQARAAYVYNLKRGEKKALRFQSELRSAMLEIGQAPEANPALRNNIRRRELRQSRYYILYTVKSETVFILAIEHENGVLIGRLREQARHCWKRVADWFAPLAEPLSWNPQRQSRANQVQHSFALVLLTLFVSLVVPWTAAWCDDVRTDSALQEKINKLCSGDECRLCAAATVPTPNRPACTEQPQQRKALLIVGFFPGKTTPAWPLALSALTVAILWFAPPLGRWSRCDSKTANRWWWSVFIGLGLLSVSANYIRENVQTFADGRRVYGHNNLDIGLASWIAYQLMYLWMMALIAIIWMRWLAPDDEWANARRSHFSTERALDAAQIKLLADEFESWQHVSVLTVIAFAPGTFLYWSVVNKLADQRYLIPAGVYHLTYAITWYVISRRLLHRWSDWHHDRIEAIASVTLELQTASRDQLDAVKKNLEALTSSFDKMQPGPRHSAAIAAFTSAASLLAPLYTLVVK